MLLDREIRWLKRLKKFSDRALRITEGHCAAQRPNPCQHALLPDSRLVLETQADAGQIDALRQGRCHQGLEFLTKFLLLLRIGLGMDRSRRQLPEAQRVHQGADRLHRQRDLENLRGPLPDQHPCFMSSRDSTFLGGFRGSGSGFSTAFHSFPHLCPQAGIARACRNCPATEA